MSDIPLPPASLRPAAAARRFRAPTDEAPATRLVLILLAVLGLGVLVRNEAGGRSTSYRLADSDPETEVQNRQKTQ